MYDCVFVSTQYSSEQESFTSFIVLPIHSNIDADVTLAARYHVHDTSIELLCL